MQIGIKCSLFELYASDGYAVIIVIFTVVGILFTVLGCVLPIVHKILTRG